MRWFIEEIRSIYFSRRMLWVDLGLSLPIAIAIYRGIHLNPAPIGELLGKDGTALYGAFLSALAALLGFAIAAIAIVAGLVSGDNFKSLRSSSYYNNFWLSFKLSIRLLAVASLISLTGIFVNQFVLARLYMLDVSLFSIVISTFSLARSGYTLEEVLKRTSLSEAVQTSTITTYDEVQ